MRVGSHDYLTGRGKPLGHNLVTDASSGLAEVATLLRCELSQQRLIIGQILLRARDGVIYENDSLRGVGQVLNTEFFQLFEN